MISELRYADKRSPSNVMFTRKLACPMDIRGKGRVKESRLCVAEHQIKYLLADLFYRSTGYI